MIAQISKAAALTSDVRTRENLNGVAAPIVEQPTVRDAAWHLHGGGWYDMNSCRHLNHPQPELLSGTLSAQPG